MVYTLPNGRQFDSKLVAERFFKAMLARHKPGQVLTSEDQRDLFSLFERHPDAAEKFARPVKDIKVILSEHRTKCFALVLDKGEVDISYLACFRKAKSHYENFCQATRRAIRPQIDQFRGMALAFPCFCPVSGVELNDRNSHVDHAYPFTFSAWISKLYKSIPDVEKIGFLWGEGPEFEDELFSDWIAAEHFRTASLRMLHKSVNLRLGANPW